MLDPVEEQLRGGQLAEQGVSVGGMTGMAGTAYALVVARGLLDEPDAGRLGELARELARCSGAEAGTDFLSGMAGALAVGLALHERATDPAERAVVAEAVRTIAARETEALGGLGLEDARVTPYTGYAHGAMGIAPVLLRYGAEFDDPAVHGLGLRILGAVLDAQEDGDRDWPRVWGEPERSYGWCHGAPGMLLGALMSNAYAPGAVSRPVLDRLAGLTLARGFGNNPTYCHGDLACAEIVGLGQELVPGLLGAAARPATAAATAPATASTTCIRGSSTRSWSGTGSAPTPSTRTPTASWSGRPDSPGPSSATWTPGATLPAALRLGPRPGHDGALHEPGPHPAGPCTTHPRRKNREEPSWATSP